MNAAGALRRHKYAALLALLLVGLAMQSLEARPGGGRLLIEALRTLLGVAILVVVLSLFGALFGLFYTAVVVSQFVGLAQSGKRETPG